MRSAWFSSQHYITVNNPTEFLLCHHCLNLYSKKISFHYTPTPTPSPTPLKVGAILTSCICNTNAAGKCPNTVFFFPSTLFHSFISACEPKEIQARKDNQRRCFCSDNASAQSTPDLANSMLACCLCDDPVQHLNLMSDANFEGGKASVIHCTLMQRQQSWMDVRMTSIRIHS